MKGSVIPMTFKQWHLLGITSRNIIEPEKLQEFGIVWVFSQHRTIAKEPGFDGAILYDDLQVTISQSKVTFFDLALNFGLAFRDGIVVRI
ncbi:MAG: hypothetical protein AAF570_00220, partial [Bacteroidota bacterium]